MKKGRRYAFPLFSFSWRMSSRSLSTSSALGVSESSCGSSDIAFFSQGKRMRSMGAWIPFLASSSPPYCAIRMW